MLGAYNLFAVKQELIAFVSIIFLYSIRLCWHLVVHPKFSVIWWVAMPNRAALSDKEWQTFYSLLLIEPLRLYQFIRNQQTFYQRRFLGIT